MYIKCCIPNCTNKREDLKLHKFPSDKYQRKKWLDAVNCDEWKALDYKSLTKLVICHRHFEKRFHTSKSGIKKIAYPTLFTPIEIKRGIPSRLFSNQDGKPGPDHSYSLKEHYDHSYCKPQNNNTDLLNYQELLTDFYNNPPTTELPFIEHLDIPADKLTPLIAHKRSIKLPTWANAEVFESLSQIRTDKAYGSNPVLAASITPNTMRWKRRIQRFNKYIPKCKRIYVPHKFSKRLINNKTQFQKPKKPLTGMKENSSDELTKEMHPLAKKFLSMQVNMFTKRRKHGRYTLEEKLLALSIVNESPDAYCFLQKIFTLPSGIVLKRLIADIGLD